MAVPAEQQVREVVARFGVATRGKDYQQICDRLLSKDLVDKIEGIGLPCESAVQRGLGGVRNPTLEINEVSISGSRALVSIHTTAAGEAPSDDALQVVREERRVEDRVAGRAQRRADQDRHHADDDRAAAGDQDQRQREVAPARRAARSARERRGVDDEAVAHVAAGHARVGAR